jgi:hypothetical protein
MALTMIEAGGQPPEPPLLEGVTIVERAGGMHGQTLGIVCIELLDVT